MEKTAHHKGKAKMLTAHVLQKFFNLLPPVNAENKKVACNFTPIK